MTSNEKMAIFLCWWAEMIMEPGASPFENVSVCMTFKDHHKVMVVSSDGEGRLDHSHEAIHHFFHHTLWADNGPYTIFAYEECTHGSSPDVQ